MTITKFTLVVVVFTDKILQLQILVCRNYGVLFEILKSTQYQNISKTALFKHIKYRVFHKKEQIFGISHLS